jgi:hypothetical protein
MSDYLLPIISFVFGAGGSRFADWYFRLKDKRLTHDKEDQERLWNEIGYLKGKLEKVEGQVDHWQQKYMDLLVEYTQIKALYEQTLQELQELQTECNL